MSVSQHFANWDIVPRYRITASFKYWRYVRGFPLTKHCQSVKLNTEEQFEWLD